MGKALLALVVCALCAPEDVHEYDESEFRIQQGRQEKIFSRVEFQDIRHSTDWLRREGWPSAPRGLGFGGGPSRRRTHACNFGLVVST